MGTPASGPGFAIADWIVVGAYLAVVLGLGVTVARRRPAGDDFFLAGRGMSVGAVSLSILATALSAATFIGGPQQAYTSDLTYLTANLGGLLASVIVATVFVPAFYRHRVTSVYELLGHACGDRVRRTASAMFMTGRVFASGARLFMVALPFALVAFGSTRPSALVASIAIIAVVATFYSAAGGIRAVIYTDVLQAVVVVGTVALAVVLLWQRLPVDAAEVVRLLRTAPDGDKLRLLDFSRDLSAPFTVWTALIGFTLFNLAAFGTDQDLTQRMLTCTSARRGAASVLIAQVLSWPVVALFLVMGLLLYVRAETAPAEAAAVTDTRNVFLAFILTDMPAGLRGLMMAGLFAAAMSSMDSALNAMAATTVADFYRPARARRDPAATPGDRAEVRVSRVASLVAAASLVVFATACVWLQPKSGETLIAFALSVMVFAYAGLLGVFLTVLLTRRGSPASAIAALITGFVAVVVMHPAVWGWWAPVFEIEFTLAFPWRMVVATGVSFAVCVSGGRRARSGAKAPTSVRAHADSEPSDRT